MKPKKKLKQIKHEMKYLTWRIKNNDEDIAAIYKLLQNLDQRLERLELEYDKRY